MRWIFFFICERIIIIFFISTKLVGKPIDVEKIPEPTDEDVQKVHQKYIEELTDLFNEHKAQYGPNLTLNII